ncbi:hypothetical protein [Ekhidna sp.]
MNIFFIIIGAIAVLVVSLIVYRSIKVNRQNRQLNEQRYERIKPLVDKLESNENLTPEEIRPYAEQLTTRETTFQLLTEHNKQSLFPEDLNNLVSGAASNLANWLEFPTELDACPDEMKHMERVTFDFDGKNNLVHYEVFKYRVNEPHWAAKDGWMLGVVGPFFDESNPYDFPAATFSRVSSTVDKVTPKEEAKWVHENIAMRR